MEARRHRNIKSGAQYDHLFPKANVDTHTVQKNAGVSDTVAFIPQVVHKTLDHTKGIANVLRGRSDYETCRNIWQFVYSHIAYRKDRDGYEQIRSPARTWHDRKSGVDCDCYTTFISSILTNLGIRHKLRITKYRRDYFQHIYPIAVLSSNKQVILDCVTDKFDYEVPFSEKKDYPMDLQYLNGINGSDYEHDHYLLDGPDDMGELGKLFGKKKGGKKKGGGFFKKIGKGLKKINLKKVLNVVNKLNPATVAMRNGVLAAMKLNVGNIAKRLRWSYMTPEQAKAKGVNFDKWKRLVAAREKLEKIFYGAGGKTSNFKKAILQGKGNKDHSVHGLEGFGDLDFPYVGNGYAYGMQKHGMHHNGRCLHHHRLSPMHPDHPVNRLHQHMPLRQVLGDDIYYSENGVHGLGELGEPVSMAMITAASGVIAAIASTLKKIGDIFGGKGKGSADFDEKTNADAEKDIPDGGKNSEDAKAAESITDNSGGGSSSSSGGGSDDSGDGGGSSGGKASKSIPSSSGSGGGGSSSGGGGGGGGGSDDGGGGGSPDKPSTSLSKQTDDGGGGGGDGGKDGGSGSGGDGSSGGFWDKNKKWIVPAGIGVAGITVLAIAAKAMKPAAAAAAPHPSGKAMHGTPHKNHHRRKKHKTVSRKTLL